MRHRLLALLTAEALSGKHPDPHQQLPAQVLVSEDAVKEPGDTCTLVTHHMGGGPQTWELTFFIMGKSCLLWGERDSL